MSPATMETFRFMDLVGGRQNGWERIGKGGSGDTKEPGVAMALGLQRSTRLRHGHALIWMSSNIWVPGMMRWNTCKSDFIFLFLFCANVWASYGSQMCPRTSKPGCWEASNHAVK